jgi:uncharacterized protein
MKGSHRARSIFFGLFLATFIVIFVKGLRAERVVDLPRPNDYVSDFANVLSPQAIARLDHICSELDHSKADAQFAIVTVHNLDGEDPADFANELEDKWKMGKKGSDRGALVLLAVDDHKYRIDVGYGLEGILNDAKIGDIGRAMVPYLRNRDYDSALLLVVGRMAQVIAADANVTLDDNVEVATRHHQSQGSGLVKLIPFLILFLMFGGFGLLRLLFGIGLLNTALGGRRYYGGPYIGGGWGGSGGGFGGGGGGGGGGDFGGFGGGSFGGGGAGGDW